MIETRTYEDALPRMILDRYEIYEVGYAAAVMKAVCPNAFADILNVLSNFTLTPTRLLTPGGNRGLVPAALDSAFDNLGWIEARVDIETTSYLIERSKRLNSGGPNEVIQHVYQQGYNIDNVKDGLAVDVEWNPKDGNLDRDLSAYRAWHEQGAIVGAALITRIQADTKRLAKHLWDDYLAQNPEYSHIEQTVTYSTTTTANYEKALERIRRGDAGTCPLLLFGIGENTWNGEPFDGTVIQKKSGETSGSPVRVHISELSHKRR